MNTNIDNTLLLKESLTKSQEKLKEFSSQVKKRQIKGALSEVFKNEDLLRSSIGTGLSNLKFLSSKSIFSENQYLLDSSIRNNHSLSKAVLKDIMLKNEEKKDRNDSYLERVNLLLKSFEYNNYSVNEEFWNKNQNIKYIKLV